MRAETTKAGCIYTVCIYSPLSSQRSHAGIFK